MARFATYVWCIFHLLALSALAWPPPGSNNAGGNKNNGRRPPPAPIPKFKVVNSDLPSLLDAFGGMWISDPYPSQYNWVTTGKDTTEGEVALLEEAAHLKGRFAKYANIPDKSKIVIRLNRYNMGNPRVTGLLIDAFKQGMTVQFMTDLSRTARNIRYDNNGRFADFFTLKPEDFESSPENQKGQAIAQMLRAGAEFANPTTGNLRPRFGIYGVMYQERPGVENPLQHMKGLTVSYEDNGQIVDIWGTDGTGNMVPHSASGSVDETTRSNRMMLEHDRVYLETIVNHFEVMREAYAKGGETRDIPLSKVPPLEEHFPNGDIRRVMFTDGQYNPHDMTAFVLLRSVIKDDRLVSSVTKFNSGLSKLVEDQLQSGEIPRENIKITKIKAKEFLLTNRSIFQALQLAMKANPQLTLEGSFDQEFAGLETQGLIASLFGFTEMREFGGNMPGVDPDIIRRNHLHIYQRMIEGAKETDRGTSWNVHHLLHDKTIMFWVTEPDGTQKVHIFTKSFNMSSHVDNAEELDEYIVSPDSPLVKAFEESIDEPIKAEPQWYIPGFNAIVRDAIGRLTGRAEVEVSLEEQRDIMRAYHNKDLRTVRDMLERLSRRPSNLANYKEMDDYRIKARLDRFMGFLEWQLQNDDSLFDKAARTAQERRETVTAYDQLDHRFAGLAVLLANQDPLDKRERMEVMRDPFQAALALHELLRTDENQNQQSTRSKREREVWEKVLDLGSMPESPVWPRTWKGGRLNNGPRSMSGDNVDDGASGPPREQFNGFGSRERTRLDLNRPSQRNEDPRRAGDNRGGSRDNRDNRGRETSPGQGGRPQPRDFRGDNRGNRGNDNRGSRGNDNRGNRGNDDRGQQRDNRGDNRGNRGGNPHDNRGGGNGGQHVNKYPPRAMGCRDCYNAFGHRR